MVYTQKDGATLTKIAYLHLSVYITHTQPSVRRRANARNVSFRISLRWPIHIIKPVDKTKFLTYTSMAIRVKAVSRLTASKVASNRIVAVLITFGCVMETFVDI